jgi:biopolymer transport protein ExbD
MPRFADQFASAEDALIIKRRRRLADTELDMTPMIDCTFLLLIFFVYSANLESPTDVSLPPAAHGAGVDPDTAVIFTVAEQEGRGLVYLGDGTIGEPLQGSAEAQDEAIRAAVESGVLEGKTNVLIKAGREVRHREVARVARAAAAVEGVTVTLYIAVKGAEL